MSLLSETLPETAKAYDQLTDTVLSTDNFLDLRPQNLVFIGFTYFETDSDDNRLAIRYRYSNEWHKNFRYRILFTIQNTQQ